MADNETVTLTLPIAYAQVLHDKLDLLCRECFFGAGIDVWLAPGGSLSPNDKGFDDLLILTPDPIVETIAIDAIHTLLRELLHIEDPIKEEQFVDPDDPNQRPLQYDINGVLLPPFGGNGNIGMGKTATVEEFDPEQNAADEREAESKG